MHFPDLSQVPFAKEGLQFLLEQGFDIVKGRLTGASRTALIDARIRETMETLITRPAQWFASIRNNSDVVNNEPALIAFIAAALEASANSPQESKRRILADLMAKRMTAKADASESMSLSVALNIIAYSTERQLILLAAVWVKNHDKDVRGSTERDINNALREQYGPVILHPQASRFTLLDIGHLQSIGAIAASLHSGAFLGSSQSKAAEWLAKRGVTGIENYPMFDSEAYPALGAWSQLLQPPTAEERQAGRTEDIGHLNLTPAGDLIGEMVVTRLTSDVQTAFG